MESAVPLEPHADVLQAAGEAAAGGASVAGGGGSSSEINAAIVADVEGGEGVPRLSTAERYTQGQLCVRLRIEPDAADPDALSQLHISRHSGDVLQFHSFYRDIRNQLAGANGWVNNQGRYEHHVTSNTP